MKERVDESGLILESAEERPVELTFALKAVPGTNRSLLQLLRRLISVERPVKLAAG